MKILFIAILVSTSAFSQSADKCQKTKIQRTAPKIEEVELCFGDSPSLYMTKNANIEKIKDLSKNKKVDIHPASSGPSLEACRGLGGSPEIIKILEKDKWISSERCVFQDTTPFSVSGAYLLKIGFPDL